MKEEHPISDEVLELANLALSKGEHWMAYNRSLYLLEKEDVEFFSTQIDANEFAENNISDVDYYQVIHFDSIIDLFKGIPYSDLISNQIMLTKDHNKTTQLSIFNSQSKTIIMNKENLQYLTDNIKYMGFGENLKADLEKNMNEGKAEFQLNYSAEINKKPFEATLNFRKSDSTDMYFFNNYQATLEKSNGEKVDQTFYLNKGKGATAKEAYNLLDGRAVHKELVTKEGQQYKAWIQLDPNNRDTNNNAVVKQFHENYGFDLKASVEKFPVVELKDPEKEKTLMQSLQKGNVQSVTIEKDGNNHKVFIEADPQYKKVNLYDANMKPVPKESVEQYQSGNKAIKEDMDSDKKKELKQDIKLDKEKIEKKNDKSLLPKKREGSKKGLGIS